MIPAYFCVYLKTVSTMKATYFRVPAFALLIALGLATSFKADSGKYFEISKNIEIFTNLYKELNTYYVDDLDPGKLMRTGIDAMVESLDPYTNYISESDIEGYRYLTEGRYNGIGAVSKKIGDYVTLTELYEDQPAAKAGLKVGDQIVAIDGNEAKGRDSEAVNEILRGFPGTEVTLTIRRPGKEGDFNVKLAREEVSVNNVPYFDVLPGGVGYAALTTFTRDAGRNVANALRDLKDKQGGELKGFILDLRDNGGGLLNEAVNLCNVFIPKNELVVSTRGKVKEWDRSFKTLNPSIDESIPLIVLVNNYSASASEIVSGVVQDYDRGVVLGQRTYGKGLVQNTRDIGYNAKVKMTTAKYYIPSGRCIQSVEYRDGEPVSIADERRTPFKTHNGRTVLDGGGVIPDVAVEKATDIGIIKSLVEQNMIFHFATDYCLKNEAPAEVESFRFTRFDDFLNFVETRNFNYETESEKLLKQLKDTAGKEGYSLDNEWQNLQKSLKADKRNAILIHKAEIVDLIEKEIIGRYFYNKGKIKLGLRNDKEIAEAVKIFNDPERYRKILSGK
jgi:carboxyl-terminal processing protease